MNDEHMMTEIGLIPRSWQIAPFYECVEITSGQVDPKVSPYMEMIHISPDCISKGTGHLLGFQTAREDGVKSGKYLFGPKDILYSKIRPNLNKVAYPRFSGLCSADMYPLTANESIINPEYVFYSILSQRFVEFASSVSTRTGIPKINRDELADYKFALPPLPEQQKIADILTTVDDHISETESLIEKTKILKQGLMQQLLTKGIGHTEFKDTEIGRIPVEWEVNVLSKVARVIMGQSPSSETYNTIGDGLPFYQGKADFGDKYPTTRMWCSSPIRIVQPDSILISVRAPVGALNLCESKSCIGRGLGAIIADDKSRTIFLYYYLQLNCSRFEKVSQGSTFTAINSGDLTEFLVCMPPLTEQRKIAAILSTVDDQIDTYQTKLNSLTRLKTGLMQQLLTGKIRVKV